MSDDDGLLTPPQHLLHLLTDAHCHPTDDPRPWDDIATLIDKLQMANVGRICAMGTSSRDQDYVAQLAAALPDKIVPAFGYHPWFAHTICQDPKQSAMDHYKSVFKGKERSSDFQELLPRLPSPANLELILHTLRRNLEAHPGALLGEVGIDRVFRLPKDPKGWSREPDDHDDNGMDRESHQNGHSLGLRKRPLSDLLPSIDHQVYIAKAQIAVAIELRRNVSFHSVRAGGALNDLLEDLARSFPDGNFGLSRREQKKRQRESARRQETLGSDDDDDEEIDSETGSSARRRPYFTDINIDLHSCTLSPDMIGQLQKKYSNIYVSFSWAINGRQKDLHAQLKACDPHRLLIESDWHSAEGLGVRCWHMLRLATDVIGPPLSPERTNGEAKYQHAAEMLHQNWLRFTKAKS